MVWVALMSMWLSATPEKPTCVNANGQTACGYSCKAESGNVKCAQTPQGICASNGGNIVCFDPPVLLARVLKTVPAPTCKIEQGTMACGYNCTSAMSELRCTKTPMGVCEARYGKTVCFDPPDTVIALFVPEVPAAGCLAKDGSIACGYNCTSGSGGTVACSKTPLGVCLARDSSPVCFDPPLDVLCALGKTIKRPTCKADFGQIVCGYDCKSSSGKVACARTPAGSCSDGAGGITCFDPPIDPAEASNCFHGRE